MTSTIDRRLADVRRARDEGRLGEAETAARAAADADSASAEAHRLLATVLWRAGRNAEAIEAYREALALDPENGKALRDLAQTLAEDGRLDEATATARSWTASYPSSIAAWSTLARLKRFSNADDPDFVRLVELAAASRRDLDEEILLGFALAKAYDELGDADHAFEWWRRANAARRSMLDYDVGRPEAFFSRIEATFDEALVRRFGDVGNPSDVPVFIVGMPRSGTSLVEQILASHPHVHGAGELLDLQELSLSIALLARGTPYPEGVADLRSDELAALGAGYVARLRRRMPDAARIVDKHPLNFRYVGLIRLILPRARILHCVRDPADTCLSIYTTNFADLPASFDLVEVGKLYCAYARLMDHWRRLFPDAIVDVRYEELVDDLEAGARALVEHCGLPWDERCLDFHTTRRTVRTASLQQVRQPIYRSSVGRWRRYERHLAPLLEQLAACADKGGSDD